MVYSRQQVGRVLSKDAIQSVFREFLTILRSKSDLNIEMFH